MQSYFLIFFNPTQPNPIYQRINDRAVQRKYGSATAHHAAGHHAAHHIGKANKGPAQRRWRPIMRIMRGGASGIDRSCAVGDGG